ncbi:MAG: HlyD family type I secretion periplasmic adaptor subunit [Cypionkella sp.]
MSDKIKAANGAPGDPKPTDTTAPDASAAPQAAAKDAGSTPSEAKSADPKSADPKSVPAKSPEAMATEAKAAPAKAAAAKSAEAKPADPKSADPKPDAPKPAAATHTDLAPASATALAVARGTALTTAVRPPKPPQSPPVNPNAWSSRKPIWMGLITIVLLLGFFVGWGMFTTISGAVVASGVIQVEQNRQVVQHPDGGVVAEIDVQEAQAVKAGDLLISLDGRQIKADLTIVEGQLFDSMARKARLEAERDDMPAPVFPQDLLDLAKARTDVAEQIEGQKRLFTARAETQNAQIDQLQKRLDQIGSQDIGIKAQMSAIDDQINLLTPEINDQQTLLDKGLTQSSRIMDLKREVARLAGNKGELLSNLAQSEGKATETQLQILQIKSARREDANTQLRDMGDKTLELAERRRSLTEQVNRLDIRAPVSGIVLGLTVTTPQSVIRAAEPILYIIPQDRPLIIIAQIPPIHVDEVHVGQAARVNFAAFSARTTPQLNGSLTNISADAITDQATHQSYYRAEVTLDAGEIARLGDEKLVPGMPVQVYVSTGDRTPMAYLLKPFTDYAKMAFREN